MKPKHRRRVLHERPKEKGAKKEKGERRKGAHGAAHIHTARTDACRRTAVKPPAQQGRWWCSPRFCSAHVLLSLSLSPCHSCFHLWRGERKCEGRGRGLRTKKCGRQAAPANTHRAGLYVTSVTPHSATHTPPRSPSRTTHAPTRTQVQRYKDARCTRWSLYMN